MSQVAKIHLSSPILLTTAIVFSFIDVFPPSAVVLFAWLGGIQLLNTFAPRLPFTRLIHWSYAMTFETFALLTQFFFRFIPYRESRSGRGQPILLVHGYLNFGSVWTVQKKRLEALGFGPIYIINLGYPFRPIRSYAEKLKTKVDSIAKETGRKDLILIGHSMGGLVSALYATQMAPSNTVTDIITMGSPFIGTPVARIGLGTNAREMEPHSPFIETLRESISSNSQIRFYHIATKTDQLVIPGGSAIIPHHKHFIFDDIGHASLLYSQRVTDKLNEWLTNCRGIASNRNLNP